MRKASKEEAGRGGIRKAEEREKRENERKKERKSHILEAQRKKIYV